jgi:adenosylmethionine-8-amino-7-oxononanoate aminotransferase
MKNNARQLIEIDHTHLWHPFTQQQEWCAEEPLLIVSGKGVYLRDIHGRDYIDGNSSIWTNIHGHAHPHIVAAIAQQAATLDHTSFLGTTHPTAIELAKRMVALLPGAPLSRVFFSDNGSTAIESALKMTFQYWQLVGHPQKNRFVAFSNCYHGDTAGAASLGGLSLVSDRFSNIRFPCDLVANIDELHALPELPSVAAIFIEPLIQGVAGMRLWPRGMLQELRRFCDEREILLIVDEVMTGFGRTGTIFACEQEDVAPDILACGKGLTGGTVPLAAIMTKEKIYEAFLGSYAELKAFCYGHSYTAHPIGCAAALACLDIFEQEAVLEKLPTTIAQLSEALATLQESAHVADVRQCGLIAGIDIALDAASNTPYPWHDRIGGKICKAAIKHGLLTRPLRYTSSCDTIVFMPPLCITEAEIDRSIEALSKAIEEVCS